MKLADQIREYAYQRIQAAKQDGQSSLTISAAEIHAALELGNRFPAVFSALNAQKFSDSPLVMAVNQRGPKQSSTTEWEIHI